jgi:hypothetical protein
MFESEDPGDQCQGQADRGLPASARLTSHASHGEVRRSATREGGRSGERLAARDADPRDRVAGLAFTLRSGSRLRRFALRWPGTPGTTDITDADQRLGGTASRAAGHFESDRHEFRKTARSDALRGGLIEGHAVDGITRMPIVDLSDGRISRTAATRERVKAERCFSGLTKGSPREMPSLATVPARLASRASYREACPKRRAKAGDLTKKAGGARHLSAADRCGSVALRVEEPRVFTRPPASRR